jgi:hypothetical protein
MMQGEFPHSLSVAEEAARNLASVDPSPFTPDAFRALIEIVNGLIGDLIDESLKTSRRHKSEIVSRSYVYHASEYLISSQPRRLFRHMGTIGGILLGGSLSNILAMAQTGHDFPLLGTLISIGIGLVGTFLVAVHVVKD